MRHSDSDAMSGKACVGDCRTLSLELVCFADIRKDPSQLFNAFSKAARSRTTLSCVGPSDTPGAAAMSAEASKGGSRNAKSRTKSKAGACDTSGGAA